MSHASRVLHVSAGVESGSDNGSCGGTWELLLPPDHVFPSSFALTLNCVEDIFSSSGSKKQTLLDQNSQHAALSNTFCNIHS